MARYPLTPFATAIQSNILKTIRELKRDGTVAMSVENLLQVTPTPSTSLTGAPFGTNAQYQYSQLFHEIVNSNPKISAFTSLTRNPKRPTNPFAVCHASTGPQRSAKFERCVMDVKRRAARSNPASDPDRALVSACMGSMGLAADWRQKALSAIQQGQSLNDFVAHSHPANRRKAVAAYRLVLHEQQGTRANPPRRRTLLRRPQPLRMMPLARGSVGRILGAQKIRQMRQRIRGNLPVSPEPLRNPALPYRPGCQVRVFQSQHFNTYWVLVKQIGHWDIYSWGDLDQLRGGGKFYKAERSPNFTHYGKRLRNVPDDLFAWIKSLFCKTSCGPKSNPVTTFPNEKLLVSDKGAKLFEVDDQRSGRVGRKMLVAVTRDGFKTDYPIRYESGQVAWDHPEWFPASFKMKVQRLLNYR